MITKTDIIQKKHFIIISEFYKYLSMSFLDYGVTTKLMHESLYL
jgi:hypothetical protein